MEKRMLKINVSKIIKIKLQDYSVVCWSMMQSYEQNVQCAEDLNTSQQAPHRQGKAKSQCEEPKVKREIHIFCQLTYFFFLVSNPETRPVPSPDLLKGGLKYVRCDGGVSHLPIQNVIVLSCNVSIGYIAFYKFICNRCP